jgi:bacterioferritin (cytochrome b1)
MKGGLVATPREADVKHLNSFLRGELSAVETYDQCIAKIEKNSQIVGTLQEARNSHERRAELLRTRVAQLGGKPAESSGAWGGFAKLVEGGAKAFGESAAVAALEEGEDHGRDDYKRDLKDVSPETSAFVQTELLPAQKQTHDTLSRLKKMVH